MTEDKSKVYDILSATIESELLSGGGRWVRTWDPSKGIDFPINAVHYEKDHKVAQYSGINREILWHLGPDDGDPRYCTFNQAKSMGWMVKKGSKGLTIEKWLSYDKKVDANGDTVKPAPDGSVAAEAVAEVKVSGLKFYSVFHASQLEGIPSFKVGPDNRLASGASVAHLAEAMGVSIKHTAQFPNYKDHLDLILMPPISAFDSEEAHDTVLLGLLNVACAHDSRLGKKSLKCTDEDLSAHLKIIQSISPCISSRQLLLPYSPTSKFSMNSMREAGAHVELMDRAKKTKYIMQSIRFSQRSSNYLLDLMSKTLEVKEEAEVAGDMSA